MIDKRLMSSLKKLDTRKRRFLFNFIGTKTNDQSADFYNFRRDLELYKFKGQGTLVSLFYRMYKLTREQLLDLAMHLESGGYKC